MIIIIIIINIIKILMVSGLEPVTLEAEICFSSTELLSSDSS